MWNCQEAIMESRRGGRPTVDEISARIWQRIREEYAQAPQRYHERFESRIDKKGPNVGGRHDGPTPGRARHRQGGERGRNDTG